MGDYTLSPASTLIVGMTGSGKTTFALRYLLNAPAACSFIFDDLGRAATRLRVQPCYTALELEAAVPTRLVLFNPHRMFPGDVKSAFRFFCAWVYEASRRGPGKKFFLVDEAWQFQDGLQIPRELSVIVQTGREENIEPVFATQLPHRINAAITGQCTELVCFKLQEEKSLARIAELGANRDLVESLPLGSFVSYDRISRASLSGRIF